MKTHPVPLKVVPYIFMVAILASTSTSILV
jgi:hypothetical protein